MTEVIDDVRDLRAVGLYPANPAEALGLKLLAKSEGFDSNGAGVVTMLETTMFAGVAPGWCSECNQPAGECEPDARSNWCEVCGGNAVQSCLVMAGLI